MNGWLKIVLRTLIILLGVLAFLHVGFNLWLQKGLPSWVEKKTGYALKYDEISVHLLSGTLRVQKLKVKTHQRKNPNSPIINGGISRVEVHDIGWYDAIFKGEITSSQLYLNEPDLSIILPKANKDKKKKKTTLRLGMAKIKDGKITILQHDLQKVFSSENISLHINDILLDPTTKQKKIPFSFGSYQIYGEQLHLRTDDIYHFNAQKIETENQKIHIEGFRLKPQMSFKEFQKRYPKKRNLFDLSTKKITFKDIRFSQEQINLSDIHFEDSRFKMFTTYAATEQKEQSFAYQVFLKNVKFIRSELEILKPDGRRNFYTPHLDLSVSNFKINEQTAKGDLPFNYETFEILANSVQYIDENQQVEVKHLHATPTSFKLENNSVRTIEGAKSAMQMKLSLQTLRGKVRDWKIENNQFFATIQTLHADQLKGKITQLFKKKNIKKAVNNGIGQLHVHHTTLTNLNLEYTQNNEPLSVKDAKITVHDFKMGGEKTQAPTININQYQLTTGALSYQTKWYNIRYAKMQMTEKAFSVEQFSVLPRHSRAQFIQLIPKQTDHYTIRAQSLSGKGTWDFFPNTPHVHLKNLTVDGVSANIYRSTIPPIDTSEKPMYSQLLREINFPMMVDQLDITNAHLEYEEDTKKSQGAGKIILADLGIRIRNLHSSKAAPSSTLIPITIRAQFMNDSPLQAFWTLNTASINDHFTINGTLNDLNAEKINHFITPYMKVKAEGQIHQLVFNFVGDKTGIEGMQKINFQDLRVVIVNNDGDKRGLLTGIANLFLRKNSKKIPKEVKIEKVEREMNRSFFNLFWKGVLSGLKKQLI